MPTGVRRISDGAMLADRFHLRVKDEATGEEIEGVPDLVTLGARYGIDPSDLETVPLASMDPIPGALPAPPPIISAKDQERLDRRARLTAAKGTATPVLQDLLEELGF